MTVFFYEILIRAQRQLKRGFLDQISPVRWSLAKIGVADLAGGIMNI
jgi:hypothetical protein